VTSKIHSAFREWAKITGDRFITGSYDRTCKVWDTVSGTELLSLEEHKNVVYTMAFNNPFG
jgi:dynein assembly factor with WDR repeat domains 1